MKRQSGIIFVILLSCAAITPPSEQGTTIQIPLDLTSAGRDMQSNLRGYQRPERDPTAEALARGLTSEQMAAEQGARTESQEIDSAARSAEQALNDNASKTMETAKSELEESKKDKLDEQHHLDKMSRRDRQEEKTAKKELSKEKLEENKVLDRMDDEDNSLQVADEKMKAEEGIEDNEMKALKIEGTEAEVRQKAEGDTALGNLAAAGKMKVAADLASKMPSSPESALHDLLNCDEIVEPETQPEEREEEEEEEESLSHVDCVPEIDVNSVNDLLKKKSE